MSLFAGLRRISPEWPLRIGLGLMYVYSGAGLIRNPTDWIGFLPQWFASIISVFLPLDLYLAIQGAVEIVIAVIFFVWFLPRRLVRLAALAAAIEMAGIIFLAGVDLVTFRDLGLLGGALALLLFTYGESKIISRA